MKTTKAPVHMTVNRPFVLAIRDGQIGAILFLDAAGAPRGLTSSQERPINSRPGVTRKTANGR